MKTAEAILSAQLQHLGFQKKGRKLLFLRFQDIIGLFGFERPSGMLYLQFAVIPLYMPCPGFIYYSYGRRLTDLYADLPTLTRSSTEEEIQSFCFRAMLHITQDVLPFMENHSTAAALYAYAERRRRLFTRVEPFIFCDPAHTLELALFSCLAAKDYDRARPAAKRYISHIRSCRYWTEDLKRSKLDAVAPLLSALDAEETDKIDAILEQNRAMNLALF